MVFPVFMIALHPWMPESPRWLSAHGRHAEAIEVLKRIHRNKHDPHDTYALLDAEQIRQQSELEKTLPCDFLLPHQPC
jgi:hypothetical protein